MSGLIINLRGKGSVLDKQQLLVKASMLEQEMFKYAYNPYKMYFLRFENINHCFLGEPSSDMFALLDKVSARKITGDTARRAVEDFSIINGDLIKLICNKDLSCGVTATTLNKVFGTNFILDFAIQLAKEVEIDRINFPIAGQLKYNGARVITLIKDGIPTFYSRGGHEFEYPELKEKIMWHPESISKTLNVMLDGELTFGDSKDEDHTKVSGLVNSSIKGTPIPKGLNLTYNVFDLMSIEDFAMNFCNVVYTARLDAVREFVARNYTDMVVVAKTYHFDNKEQLSKKYEELLAEGYEGLILKHMNHVYTFKKNATWIKMKATETADLLCTGYQEGLGKYQGRIGSLDCEGIIDGKRIKVNVGSGLTDYDRDIHPNNYIGHTIEIKYNKLIRDTKTGQWSLFLPRFVIVRKDKS